MAICECGAYVEFDGGHLNLMAVTRLFLTAMPVLVWLSFFLANLKPVLIMMIMMMAAGGIDYDC